jgi:hypothetical protein
MKNLVKLIGIIALAAVIVFSMAACGDGGGGGGGKTGGGNKLPFLESEHFIITCYEFEENESTLFKLRDKLEGSYDRITTTLQVSFSNKTEIILYPSQSAAGFSGFTAGMYVEAHYHPPAGAVIMVTPSNPTANHDFNYMLKVAVHEFVHVAAAEVNPIYPPTYLCEGVAVYLAGQGEYVGNTIKSNAFPATLSAIPNVSGPQADAAYDFAYAFVEYVVHKYGNDKLVALYKNPDDLTVLGAGVTEALFMSEWKDYCKTKYK